MKKVLLLVSLLFLVVLTACMDQEESPKLIQVTSTKKEFIPISAGEFYTGDQILHDNGDSYYFGGFVNNEGTILSITVAFNEKYNFSYGQEFNYIFSKDSTFKLPNGIVLKVVDWNLSENKVKFEQLTN